MGRNRWAGHWQQHKQWIRDVVINGTPYAIAAAAHGFNRVTAWRVLQRRDVQRYVSSLRRWQTDKALQARIERDIHACEVPGDE